MIRRVVRTTSGGFQDSSRLKLIEDLSVEPTAVVYSSTEVSRFNAVGGWLKNHPIPKKPLFLDKFTGAERPYSLAEVEVPAKVFLRGLDPSLINNDSVSVGISGASTPSNQNKKFIMNVIKTISSVDPKAVVVSGGATGADTFAHRSALENRIKTIVVRPTIVSNHEIDKIEVSEKQFKDYLEFGGVRGREGGKLVRDILAYGGLLLAEHDDFKPDFNNFRKRLLDRDRLLTAASDILMMTECIHRSGTLDTAYRAVFQGKYVVAVDWRKIIDFRDSIRAYERWKMDNNLDAPMGAGESVDRVDEFNRLWKEKFWHVPRIEGNDTFLSYLGGHDRGSGVFARSYRFPTREITLRELQDEFAGFFTGIQAVVRMENRR